MNPKPLTEIEAMLSEDERRPLSIAGHHAWRESIAGPDREFDEIDEAAADPIHDHLPQSAPRHKVRGVLSILDQLDKENPNRRFGH